MRKFFFSVLIALCLGTLCAGIVYWEIVLDAVHRGYAFVTDRAQVSAFITSFGVLAPAVFIAFQILQVIFAPFPGELSGFIGGYLFGVIPAFLYSSIGLTAGSLINFFIGRFLGKRFVRNHIPPKQLEKFDHIVGRDGVLVLFILFVFPGFPKDYLCLFLGLSAIPLRIFILMTAIGRMPGTLMLSVQGAFLYDGKYEIFAILTIVCLILAFWIYRYREDAYRWIEKLNTH